MPDLTHWRNPDHRELLLSGLRLAAGEGASADPPPPRRFDSQLGASRTAATKGAASGAPSLE